MCYLEIKNQSLAWLRNVWGVRFWKVENFMSPIRLAWIQIHDEVYVNPKIAQINLPTHSTSSTLIHVNFPLLHKLMVCAQCRSLFIGVCKNGRLDLLHSPLLPLAKSFFPIEWSVQVVSNVLHSFILHFILSIPASLILWWWSTLTFRFLSLSLLWCQIPFLWHM